MFQMRRASSAFMGIFNGPLSPGQTVHDSSDDTQFSPSYNIDYYQMSFTWSVTAKEICDS